jgi:hypothetical protein
MFVLFFVFCFCVVVLSRFLLSVGRTGRGVPAAAGNGPPPPRLLFSSPSSLAWSCLRTRDSPCSSLYIVFVLEFYLCLKPHLSLSLSACRPPPAVRPTPPPRRATNKSGRLARASFSLRSSLCVSVNISFRRDTKHHNNYTTAPRTRASPHLKNQRARRFETETIVVCSRARRQSRARHTHHNGTDNVGARPRGGACWCVQPRLGIGAVLQRERERRDDDDAEGRGGEGG